MHIERLFSMVSSCVHCPNYHVCMM